MLGLGAGCASGGEQDAAGAWAGSGGAWHDAGAGGGGAAGGGASAASGGLGGGSAASGSDAGGDAPVVEGGAVHPLCAAGCRLDDPAACPASGAGGGADGSVDAAPDGGPGQPPDAGDPDSADGGGVVDAGTLPGTVSACRVEPLSVPPVTACGPAGGGAADSPCLDSRDCAPGFGCVGSGAAGRCRPFCCTPEGCAGARSFCDERPLRLALADAGAPTLAVPVCIVPDDCNLAEESPCTTNSCKCSAGTACMVVGPSGATACVVPGAGRTGEACPCARGFVCSKATQTCLKLCPVALSAADCGGGSCQGDSNLPDGWGICVGGGSGDAGP